MALFTLDNIHPYDQIQALVTTMHYFVALSILVPLAISQSLIFEAQDGICGYLNGMKLAPYGCHATTQKCAVYYPTSFLAAGIIADISGTLTSPTTSPLKMLTPRAAEVDIAAITPAPDVDYPEVVCCDLSKGDCTAQPTACVDAYEHPYSVLCAGNCPNDSMTLKCTAGHTLHCNRIEFQSPLHYQRSTNSGEVVDAREVEMGVAREPARGWFCGASALPTKFVESTIISRRPIFEDETSAASISQFTMIPQLSSPKSATLDINTNPQSGPNLGAVDGDVVPPDDYDYEPDVAAGDDCCVDEAISGQDCCNDDAARLARRLQRRRGPEAHRVGITVVTTTVTSPSQIGLATIIATPDAAPAMTITEGLAFVSTTYGGQSDRSPFTEATRSWNILIPAPTLNATTTSKNSTHPHGPGRPIKKSQGGLRPAQIGRIIGGVIGGVVGLFLLVILVRWCNRRRKAGKAQSEDEDSGVHNQDQFARPAHIRVHHRDKYTETKSRLSVIDDRAAEESTTSNRLWTWVRGIPTPEMSSPKRNTRPRHGVARVLRRASSVSGSSADDEKGITDGSSLSSDPYYHAMISARNAAMRKIRPNPYLGGD